MSLQTNIERRKFSSSLLVANVLSEAVDTDLRRFMLTENTYIHSVRYDNNKAVPIVQRHGVYGPRHRKLHTYNKIRIPEQIKLSRQSQKCKAPRQAGYKGEIIQKYGGGDTLFFIFFSLLFFAASVWSKLW